MIKGKRVISLVLALALIAGLCACAKPGANTDDNWFEDSSILNTEFTREKLAQTEVYSVVDYSYAAKDWAFSFVEENYLDCQPTRIYAKFISGHNSVPSVFKGTDAVFSTMSYWVQFQSDTEIEGLSLDETGLYGFHLQVIMKRTEDRVNLLGFVTNQTRQINRPVELARFLKAVPGYANLQVAEPEAEGGIGVIDLTEKMGGLKVLSAIPAENTLYVFGYDADHKIAGKGENDATQAKGVLNVFSAKTLKLIYKYALTVDTLKPRYFEADGEDLIFSLDTSDGGYYHASKTGVTKLESAPEKAKGIYRLSDSAVIIQTEDGGLALEQDRQITTLFTGIPFEVEKDNMGESVGYMFRYRLSDTAFVYSKYGYEWLMGSSVYDISTKIDTPIPYEHTGALYPVAAGNGKVVLVPDYLESESVKGPFIFDLSTGETRNADWLMLENDRSYPQFTLSGYTLAIFSVDDNGLAIRLCDLNNGTVNKLFEMRYQAAQPSAIYDIGDTFWFTTDAYSLSDTYLFYISK